MEVLKWIQIWHILELHTTTDGMECKQNDSVNIYGAEIQFCLPNGFYSIQFSTKMMIREIGSIRNSELCMYDKQRQNVE